MSVRRPLLGLSLSFLCLGELALAQGKAQGSSKVTTNAAAAAVTATAGPERVRFVAPSDVVRIRVELFSESGQSLLDVNSKGNVFDWTLQDGNGQAVADGSYVAVVTVKSVGGAISQRVGAVSVTGSAVSLSPAQPAQLTAAQQEAVGPLEWNSALTVLPQRDVPAATVVGHDGKDGQVTSTTGALTFRTGDVFAGTDKEAMRVTPEGLVGIGTDKPEATLDVAGTLRARGGITFDDGSVVTSTGGLARTNPDGTLVAAVSGTGTPNQVTKWIDSAGTLANSGITEVAGFVGINTTNPGGQLHIFGAATQDVFAGMGPDVISGPAFNYGYAGGSYGSGAGFFNARPDLSASPPNPSLRFATNNFQHMILTQNGNFGIGNLDPQAKLVVTQTYSGNSGTVVDPLAVDVVVDNAAHNQPALRVTTNGGGRAGHFVVNRPNSSQAAVRAESNGSGSTLFVDKSSATGRAGRIEITNATNPANALEVTTTGTGFSALFTGGQGVNVTGNFQASGTVRVGTLAAGSATLVCHDANVLTECSSSLRYKTGVKDYKPGLEILSRLRPVDFQWKGRDERDLGFIAEEVNQVEPRLSTYDDNGQIVGVKYMQLSTVFVNAIKEQQQQIEELRAELANLKHGPAQK